MLNASLLVVMTCIERGRPFTDLRPNRHRRTARRASRTKPYRCVSTLLLKQRCGGKGLHRKVVGTGWCQLCVMLYRVLERNRAITLR
jgi:hypothetical protein